jgi:hypothetical protein
LSGNSSSYEVMYTSDEQIRTLWLFGSSVGSWEESVSSDLAATAGSGGPFPQSVGPFGFGMVTCSGILGSGYGFLFRGSDLGLMSRCQRHEHNRYSAVSWGCRLSLVWIVLRVVGLSCISGYSHLLVVGRRWSSCRHAELRAQSRRPESVFSWQQSRYP